MKYGHKMIRWLPGHQEQCRLNFGLTIKSYPCSRPRSRKRAMGCLPSRASSEGVSITIPHSSPLTPSPTLLTSSLLSFPSPLPCSPKALAASIQMASHINAYILTSLQSLQSSTYRACWTSRQGGPQRGKAAGQDGWVCWVWQCWSIREVMM